MKNEVLHLFTAISLPPSHFSSLVTHSSFVNWRLMTNFLAPNFSYIISITILIDQAVVIGIEKKEDKWHEKWGLASLYDNLVPSSSFRRPCYTLLLCELETNDTLDQREGKKPLVCLLLRRNYNFKVKSHIHKHIVNFYVSTF